MEKAKAYIKNELRGGSILQSDSTSTSQAVHTIDLNDGIYRKCFVCGACGNFTTYPLRVRQNPERLTDPYFPFLENHEPPDGLLPVSQSQANVYTCSVCHRLLTEQWNTFERENRPHMQRVYYIKRHDGKNFIGVNTLLQGEYAAQVLGINPEHLPSNELINLSSSYRLDALPPPPPQHQHSMHRQNQQSDNLIRPSSRGASPLSKTPTDSYYSKKERDNYNFNHLSSSNNSNSINQYQSGSDRPSSRNDRNERNERNTTTPNHQLSRPLSRPHSRDISSTPPTGSGLPLGTSNSGSGTSSNRITYSPFAQHKLKLGTHFSSSPVSQASIIPPVPPLKSNRTTTTPPTFDSMHNLTNNNKGLSVKRFSKSAAYSPYAQNDLLQQQSTNLSNSLHCQPHKVINDDNRDHESALDLRNTTQIQSTNSPATLPPQHQAVSSNANQTSSDVGILDLSMPDKNSITEVCYVCGDEYRRGSLLELSTVEPKDAKDRNKPYFPIFGETHPRPARSRPKDPRGMIQACTPCYDHLMRQWNHFRVSFT